MQVGLHTFFFLKEIEFFIDVMKIETNAQKYK